MNNNTGPNIKPETLSKVKKRMSEIDLRFFETLNNFDKEIIVSSMNMHEQLDLKTAYEALCYLINGTTPEEF